MLLLIISALSAGLFAGAAIYISLVEHPARVSCGTDVALAEFAPSYRRATVMQASLAVIGCVAGLVGAWQRGDVAVLAGALLLGSVVPFTLIVILPTNARLLDPELPARGGEASALLSRWARFHAVRSVLASAAFIILVTRLAAGETPERIGG